MTGNKALIKKLKNFEEKGYKLRFPSLSPSFAVLLVAAKDFPLRAIALCLSA